ncbi:MAG TPA: galactose oxidase early set domain-containing protein [Solirubrobacterales bacterium]|nr:galactose oxidase early set domain-containing protein [Solirubrobacterales bacterium]
MPWDPTTIESQVLAVHAAFVNYDRIVFFGGDQHDEDLSAHHEFDATCLFDCRSGSVTRIASPPFDVFCCGHALTTLGTLMVAGGTFAFPGVVPGDHHDHFPGLRDTAIFRHEPGSSGFRSTALLSSGEKATPDARRTGGRWYPTLLTLANGDVLAMSGHAGEGDREHNNFIPEVFTPTPLPGGAWHRLGSFENAAQRQLFWDHQTTDYPRVHLLPTGDVLFASPTLQGNTVTMTVGENPWSATFHPVCRFSPLADNAYGGYKETSVLLPLRHEEGYRPRVLICGAERAWTLDLKNWRPGTTAENTLGWQRAPERKLLRSTGGGASSPPRRINGNVVLLPTGEVLAVGGVAGVPQPGGSGFLELDSTAVLEPEIYNPFTNAWSAMTTPGERATVPRNYHSVALLMPDGRVWTAGSDHDAGRGIAAAELRIEIYEPWYHHRPGRPEILAAPDRWGTGEQFSVRTTQADEIIRVALLRCGSCTHAFNPDQRYVTLKFDHTGGDELLVTAPPNGNVAPSGLYFLYTINQQGLPSAGTTLYVSSTPRTEGERQWDALFQGRG